MSCDQLSSPLSQNRAGSLKKSLFLPVWEAPNILELEGPGEQAGGRRSHTPGLEVWLHCQIHRARSHLVTKETDSHTEASDNLWIPTAPVCVPLGESANQLHRHSLLGKKGLMSLLAPGQQISLFFQWP